MILPTVSLRLNGVGLATSRPSARGIPSLSAMPIEFPLGKVLMKSAVRKRLVWLLMGNTWRLVKRRSSPSPVS